MVLECCFMDVGVGDKKKKKEIRNFEHLQMALVVFHATKVLS